ncbi:hypothetical protein PT974_01855 [Cladobotryum mycophilum]|uniref:F-box domain-containing protein n=1 Tax=Cladobotryum mycophilum TaxID=491253 RepID=A0ABR0SWE5_9HYPO
MNLGHLAPELLHLIMGSVDSPQSLSSLLSASPACWRIYSSSPERILACVVRNMIPRELINHYLALINAPSLGSDKQAFRRDVSILLEWYFNSEPSEYPTAKDDLISLCRLHTRISYFSDGYFESAINALLHGHHKDHLPAASTHDDESKEAKEMSEGEQEMPTGSMYFVHPLGIQSARDFRASESNFVDFRSKPIPYVSRPDLEIVEMNDATRQPFTMAMAPSNSERIRFLRAFLRFEVFCKAFPDFTIGEYREGTHDANEQSHLFVNHLEAWEVEEMSCDHQYYSLIITSFIEELKSDLLEAVVTAPGVVFPWSQVDKDNSRETDDAIGRAEAYKKLVPFDALERIGMDLYSNDFTDEIRRPYDNYISYITSLGAEFTYRLVRSDKVRRSALIRSRLVPFDRPSLPEAIEHAESRNSETIQPDNIEDKDPARANLGYYLFKSTPLNKFMRIGHSPLGSPLRELAYVFWDSWRIRLYTVWRKLYEAKHTSEEEMDERLSRRISKSPEERLRGVKLPWGEKLRLAKEFGSIVHRYGGYFDEDSEEDVSGSWAV